ncbi:beta-1,6-N-acetylglucosaminyltransferase [Lactobacillus hamsteri]|uniref:Peptide O-xylosyltransferase n=2 Tax=Lactobacillus hamsteri TaxID=96565 RepID=A0A0R1Y6E2_9LACO|nr:beta-1,6-N-acetylglucosaminyltransferase [Lactobacillus hamsteri]KRM37317.1 hypothetical protein FC39_GL000225 [Lactobacillus hamsteri DSM 5661 = JCM 6256]
MKHAIMVIGSGTNADVLQETINVLDDPEIDFYIHWDKKFNIPKLNSEKSNILFLPDRISVQWGNQTQIEATIKLLEIIKSKKINYDYIHLISSNDMPLMTVDYFKKYFNKEVYLEYDHPITSAIIHRVSYYYPANIDFRKHKYILKLFKLFNSIFRINRLKNLKIKKGANWFSIKYKYVNEILNSNLKIFYHGFCADEIFVQTILHRFDKIPENVPVSDANYQAARYIDWKRGGPYVFKMSDISELKLVINTKYAFARKIKDPNIIKKVFNEA